MHWGQKMLRNEELSMPFNIETASIFHETSRKIPTTIGLPIRVRLPLHRLNMHSLSDNACR